MKVIENMRREKNKTFSMFEKVKNAKELSFLYNPCKHTMPLSYKKTRENLFSLVKIIIM